MLTIKTLHFHVSTNCENKSVAHYFGSDLVFKRVSRTSTCMHDAHTRCMHVLISFCYLS